MKIFLPLFYSLLVLAGQAPEAFKDKPQDKVVKGYREKHTSMQTPEDKSLAFHRTLFSMAAALPEQPLNTPTNACRAIASLIDAGAGTSGTPYMNCSTNDSYTLTVQNTSATQATNTGYTINWGDGSAPESFGREFTTARHTYTIRGAYDLRITALDDSGCESSPAAYRVFNISNPGFMFGTLGSTTACLSPESPTATFRFPAVAAASNPTTTTYTFTFDDGSPNVRYTHREMLERGELVHTFRLSSCSKPNQRFTIKAVAEYICNGVTKRTEGNISSIVINQKVNADFPISGGPNYCAGNEVRVGASGDPQLCPVTYAWTLLDGVEGVDWQYTVGNSSTAGNTIKFLQPGTYRIRLKTTTEGCGDTEATKSITIAEATKADFDFSLDKSSGCEDLLVNTTNNSTGGNLSYSWAIDYNNQPAVANTDYTITSGTLQSAAPKFLLTKPGVYALKLTASNACAPTTHTRVITVKGLPTAAFQNNSLRNCGPFTVDYTDQYTITENNGSITGYTWEVDNGGTFTEGTSSSSANPKIHFPAPGVYRVRLTVRNACGNARTTEQRVTIYEIPDAPAVAGKTVCKNSAAVLAVPSPLAGYTYRWYEDPDSRRKVYTGTTFITPALTEDVVYYVDALSNNNCVSTTRTTVQVRVVPELEGGNIIDAPETNLCYGGSPGELDGAAPTGGTGDFTYQWHASTASANSGYTPVEGAINRSYTPDNMTKTTWFKREAIAISCTNIMSNVVRVDVAPVLPAPTIAGNTAVCSGGSTFLFATAPGGTYRWYSEAGTLLHMGATFTTERLSETTTFEVEAEGNTGCISPRTSVTVDVVPVINNSITASKQSVCKGEDAGTITGSISGGNGDYVILWEQSVGGMAFTAANGINNEETYNPGPLTASTTFRRTVRSGSCEVRSNTVTININSSTGNNLISGSKTICPNSSPGTLSGNSESTYSYQWYASTTSATDDFTAVATATDHDYTPAPLSASTWFRREIIAGTCRSMSNTLYVQVEEGIENNSISTTVTEVCAGSKPGIITGSAPDGGSNSQSFLWQWAKVSEPGSYVPAPGTNTNKDYVPNPNDPALNLREAVYFRRIVTSGMCGQSTSAPVMIAVIPPVVNAITSTNTTLCANTVPEKFFSSAPVSGGKPGMHSYRWERSLNGGPWNEVATTEEYVPADALPAGTTQYRRWIGSGSCAESRSNTLTVTVNPEIAGNELAAVAPVCVGMKVDLQGRYSLTGGDNTRYGYQWEKSLNGTSFFVLTGETEATYSPVVMERSWFRRVVTSGSCSSVSNSVEVQVEQPVTVSISGGQSLCPGVPLSTLQITSVTGSGSSSRIQWEKSESGEAGPYTAIPGATASDYQPAAITKPTWFRVSISGGNCATATSNAEKVQYYPEIVNSIGEAQTLCQGSAATPLGSTVAVSGGDGVHYNYQWQHSADGIQFTDITGQNREVFAPGNVLQRTWFRRVVYSGGCEATSDAVAINVTAAPANTISISNAHICFNTRPERITSGGQPLQSNSGPYTFSWFRSIDGLIFTEIRGAVAESYEPEVLTQTTWFRRVVRSQVCGTSESNIVKVQVDQQIEENYIKNGDKIFCFGQNISKLEGSTPTGGTGTYTYKWLASTQGPTTGFMAATGTNTGKDYTPTDLERTTWFKRVVYSSPCQEATSAPVKIEVVPLPVVPEAANARVCLGQSTVLTATAAAGETVEWYDKPTGGKLLGTGPDLNTGKLRNNINYFVQATNKNACTSAGRRQVSVEIVTPQVSVSSDVTITEGKSVQLQAQGGVQYQWSPAESLSDPTSASPMANPTATTTYTVTATTAEGCSATTQVTVTVVPKVQPANVLTANSDGLNDKFVIKNIENYPDARVEIFNRWGQKVFESKGYTQAWDGTRNGTPLPVAAYYYIIYLNNNEEPISGSITIIK